MLKRWNVKKPEILLQVKLAKACNILPLTSQVLINRGLKSASSIHDFLEADIGALFDPFQLPDMSKAVKRIQKAIKGHENILVYGDYDVDGVTACATIVLILTELKLQPSYYIPHRIREGYGLSKAIVKFCKKNKISLVITVDCGICDFDVIKQLSKFKIDTVVIDHHQPHPDKLPDALAIINPKRKDSQYPFVDLSGVGLAFKVAQALTGRPLAEYLDLVALGTVADVVPLNGENRILVKLGLKALEETKRVGLRSLMQIAGIHEREMIPRYISYILGPRINASGRMDTAHTSLQLLLSSSCTKAEQLAQDLNLYNQMRQKVENGIFEEALHKIETEINFKEHSVITLGEDGWHIGVLGIVASKIADRFNRPAIIISFDKEVGKGSCRSIKNFHILDALSQCKDYLQNFGGHHFAAGLTINKKHFRDFCLHINRIASEVLTPEDFLPSLDIDAMAGLGDLSPALISELERLAPFGRENPKPIFYSKNLLVRSKPKIMGRDTLKFWVTDTKFTYQAIGFGMSKFYDLVVQAENIDMAYSLAFDHWQGCKDIQLEVQDIKLSR